MRPSAVTVGAQASHLGVDGHAKAARCGPAPTMPAPSRPPSVPLAGLRPAALLLGLASMVACDIATIPTTAADGLGRPAVAARVLVEVEGLPPAIEAMDIDVASLAIRRTRDRQWLPLVAGSTTVVVSPDNPVAELTLIPLGADTYDRVEVITDGVHLSRQGHEHEATLDREDATLAVQWVFDHDVDLTLCIDYRADVELTADSLDMVFAPLAHLE